VIKVFSHTFSNGHAIKVAFDTSKDMPYCEENFATDIQPNEVYEEYKAWQESVLLPWMMENLSKPQLRNMLSLFMTRLKSRFN